MIKEEIAAIITKVLEEKGISSQTLSITPPANAVFGDYATNIALTQAKNLKKKPMDLAQELAQAIPVDTIIEKVEVIKPGFINIWIQRSFLLEKLQHITENATYGQTEKNKDKKVIVEFSSPNIAKPFTIGHLRSTIIGDAIAKLLAATGYTVYRDNHVGDWGTQFGKLIYAIKTWGNLQEIEKAERPVKVLVDLYVKFHDESEKNAELEDEGRKWFKKLEDGDPEARKLWNQCIEWSWKEFSVIYEQLGVTFTENDGRGYGESFFEDKMKEVLVELEQKLGPSGQYKESKDARLVFFPNDKYPPLMILKQDGSTLYSTRDLATDKFRLSKPEYGPDVLIINEVGIEQSLYFNQLYETEKMLGWVKEGQRVHIKHGLYRFKDMKMSTRKGNVIWLEDVLAEGIKRASQLSKQNIEIEGQEVISTSNKQSLSAKKHIMPAGQQINNWPIIGIGAIKWNDLKRNSHLDIVFDWDEILNMDGNSGPYIQYTYVRCKSVLEKASPSELTLSQGHLTEEEMNLIRLLVRFPEVIHDAAANFAPNQLCTYLFETAQSYNLFYQKYPILKATDKEQQNRIIITQATARVLQNGLKLLGIHTVERM